MPEEGRICVYLKSLPVPEKAARRDMRSKRSFPAASFWRRPALI